MRSRKREVGQRVARPAEHQAKSGFDVDGLEDLYLLGEREVGGVTGDVGETAGLGDLAQLRRDLTRPATEQDVLQDCAVLARQLDHVRGRLTVVEGFGLHPQGVARPGNAGADRGALVTADDDGLEATGQRTLFHHLGDDADVRVTALDVGHQE